MCCSDLNTQVHSLLYDALARLKRTAALRVVVSSNELCDQCRSENAAFMASLGFIRAEALGFQGRTAEAELTALANDLGWQVITHPFDGPLARTLDLPDAPFYVLPDLLIRGAMPAPVLRRYLTARDGD